MEDVIMIDPHTLEVNVVLHKKCTTCRRVLPVDTQFQELTGGRYNNKCRRCYDRMWMAKQDRAKHKTVEQHVRSAVTRANRRSRLRRSKGDEITNDEAMRLWESCEGKCANCRVKLNWDFHPRVYNENKAVLDRVETSENLSYAGNARWMCTVCNEEKGGWDLAHQLQTEINELRSKLKRKRKKRECGLRFHSH